MRVGFLKFRNGFLHFDNLASEDQFSKTSCGSAFRINKFSMTGIPSTPKNLDDQISYRSSLLSNRRSVFEHRSHIRGHADPNTIDLKTEARRPRDLNSIVEGKYGKRMSINGKDKYGDLYAYQQNQRAVLDQDRALKDNYLLDKFKK